MTCDRRRLSFYRDGALSLDERYELECHLNACRECGDELRRLMRLAQVIRSLPVEAPPTTLRQDVARLAAERRIVPRRRTMPAGGLWRALAPAAVAASVALSALVAFRPGALELPSPIGQAASQPALSQAAPASQPSASTSGGASAQAGAPAASTASAAPPVADGALPPIHLPVSQAGSAASLPTKLAGPSSVPSPIARLYGSNQQVRELLGAAAPGSRTVTLLEQSFQGGLAIWRSDTREIYVLRRQGNTWSVYPDTWRPGDSISVDQPPPPGAMVPAGGFGSLWRSSPEVKSRLGWAVYEPRGSGGAIQTFERGLIVWSPHGLLYVLSNDGRWRTFPDATSV